MTAKSKTKKTQGTPLGMRNAAAARPKKSRVCGYFDCPGCDHCKHVSADRVAAYRISEDSSGCLPTQPESSGAAARLATPGVTGTHHVPSASRLEDASRSDEAMCAAPAGVRACDETQRRERMSAAIRKHFPYSAGSSHDELVNDFLVAAGVRVPDGSQP